MSEQSRAQCAAQVVKFENGGWAPLEGGGVVQIHLYQNPAGSYRVVAGTSVNTALTPGLVFEKASDNFIQYQNPADGTAFGFNVVDVNLANSFFAAVQGALAGAPTGGPPPPGPPPAPKPAMSGGGSRGGLLDQIAAGKKLKKASATPKPKPKPSASGGGGGGGGDIMAQIAARAKARKASANDKPSPRPGAAESPPGRGVGRGVPRGRGGGMGRGRGVGTLRGPARGGPSPMSPSLGKKTQSVALSSTAKPPSAPHPVTTQLKTSAPTPSSIPSPPKKALESTGNAQLDACRDEILASVRADLAEFKQEILAAIKKCVLTWLSSSRRY